MSINVDIEALASALPAFGSEALLITVGPESQPHVVSVKATMADGVLSMGLGLGTRANVEKNAAVTLVWPGGSEDNYCLIVDGDARTPGASDVLVVEPTAAVLHRLAGAASDLPKCIAVEPGMRQPTRR